MKTSKSFHWFTLTSLQDKDSDGSEDDDEQDDEDDDEVED